MSNELQVLVDESGLETTKAKLLLDKFSDYFEIASEWEKKAKSIIVTDESQTEDMELAKTGRLFLKEKRIALEKTRKSLKEQSLREGKAIDGIANVLKSVIVPTEEYLKKQENFVALKEEAEREAKRKEIERRMEEERIAEEKAFEAAKAAEREKMRIENERLKAEAVEKDRLAEIERQKQAKAMAKQKAEFDKKQALAEEKLRKEKEAARIEQEKAREAKLALQAEIDAVEKKRADAEKEAQKQREIDAEQKRKLEEELASQIECPHCHKKFSLK
jgi:hypothetical protein